MGERVSKSREFVRGAARFADLVYVISQMKTLLEQDIAHVSLVGLYKGNWGDAFNSTWNATAIAVAKLPSEKVVLIGEDGDVSTYVSGRREDELIDPRPVMIRNAREIGGHVHACGSKRQVFRRVGDRQWVDMSAPPAAQTEVFGFEALDGYAENEIYAAGWGGEIWRYDGSAWTQCGSPTNVILTAVCCAGDGTVYVGGQGGVLVSGRGDVWASVAWEDEVTADLWDLCWFRDRLYVATMSQLYTLDADRLVPVDYGGMGRVTCYSLSVAQGVLWSVGKADVASFDGTTWQKYD
ncbi:hypothetical protein [Variovorax sp. Root434]|uniref:hypothetical protein n=1 Tax=Variovorax sp. Root434 TaxID=1736536 RepID=UPI000A7E634C|nr:hypothetical protein [Variovorax sp. Root434]